MKEGTASRWGKDFNPSAFIQSSMLNQLDRDMLREVGLRVSMDCIACFMTRTWGIAEFQAEKFEKVDVESKNAQSQCAKAEQALSKAIKANKTSLQSAEDSQKSLEDT